MIRSNFFLPIDKPTIFSLPSHLSANEIRKRLECDIIDNASLWQQELPEAKEDTWAYYPWRNTAIHIPNQEDFRKIFFSRNYPLIDQQTQNNLWDIQIGIAGLSVGSNIALELAKTGISKFTIADPDSIAISNNNRLAGGNLFQIGENKTTILARKIYELNPYAHIEQFPEGLNDTNFTHFVRNCSIIIDEVDAFPIKNKLRDYIHSPEGKNTTLIMGTDLGENPVVEVERYEDPKFGGRVTEEEIQKILQGRPNKTAATRMFVSVMGKENIPPALLQNFINIKQGKQAYWAQLGLAATAVAAQIAQIVVDIARGNAESISPFSPLILQKRQGGEKEKQIRYIFEKEFASKPPVEKILFSSAEEALDIARQDLPDGRRKIGWQIGDAWIEITEIPACNITDQELAIIRKARESYRIWGDAIESIINDPLDRKWVDNAWETRHLIASIQSPNFQKTIALKATYASLSYLDKLFQEGDIPEDLAVWKLKKRETLEEKNLWDTIKVSLSKFDQNGKNIVFTSRLCTYDSQKPQKKSGIYKELTAITFALMHFLLTDTKPPYFILSTLTQESIHKIFSISGPNQKKLAPIFHKLERTLEIDSQWMTAIDDDLPLAQTLKAKFSGYWVKNHPQLFMTEAKISRQSALALLKAAKEKYG